jgi:hypothetical protein
MSVKILKSKPLIVLGQYFELFYLCMDVQDMPSQIVTGTFSQSSLHLLKLLEVTVPLMK